MGITRQYLRWVQSSKFGAITSHNGSVLFVNKSRITGQLIATSACESIVVWDLKTGEMIKTFTDGISEVTSLCWHENGLIGSGHSDGTVKIFDFETGELKVTFSGHKSAVTCVTFDNNGMRLASGGKDTEIVLWDVINECGLFRLKGHKNPVTKLQFMTNRDIIVSSSKDTFIKFWDLNTQHCFKTLVGHRTEVWSFVLINNDCRLISGGNDSELKVWDIIYIDNKSDDKELNVNTNIKKDVDDNDDDDGNNDDDNNNILIVNRIGSIMRKSMKRLANIYVDNDCRILICHGNDQIVECFKLRSDEEIKLVLKKRERKERKRLKRSKPDSDDIDTDNVNIVKTLNDEIERICDFKASDKVKSCDLQIINNEYKVITQLMNNSIEFYSIKNAKSIDLIGSIKIGGHRTDVRTVSFSSDNYFMLSASGESLKIWSKSSQKCITTITEGFEYALCSLFIPGDRYCVLGTKSGKLQIYEIGSAQLQESIVAADDGLPIWSVCLYPNQKGLVSGSEDKNVKFWDFEFITETESKKRKLTLMHERTLEMDEGILCVKISPNSKFIAVSLLDSTVKIFFMDSLKFFLSLYGHKFPVLCLDISYDSTLIVTGSSDKNVKIWGLDFGDCHKSIFAHDDSITCVQFVPQTHYFFTASKDRTIKQWNADNYDKIITLEGHQSDIWSLAVSPNGKYLLSASHDKSLRIWEKTDEPLVLEEEREDEREREFEKTEFGNDESIIPGETNKETALAAKKTVETIKGTERLIEALDVFNEEIEALNEYNQLCHHHRQMGKDPPQRPAPNPLMNMYNTICPYRYILEALRRIKSSELEETLLTLPFNYVTDLLNVMTILLEKNWDTEMICRCASFIMRVHFGQLISTSMMVPTIDKLRNLMKGRVQQLKDLCGLNLYGLHYYHSILNSREETSLFTDALIMRKENKRKRVKRQLSAPILSWT